MKVTPTPPALPQGATNPPDGPGPLEAKAREAADLWPSIDNLGEDSMRLPSVSAREQAYAKMQNLQTTSFDLYDAIAIAALPTQPRERVASSVATFILLDGIGSTDRGLAMLRAASARRALAEAPGLAGQLCPPYLFNNLLCAAAEQAA